MSVKLLSAILGPEMGASISIMDARKNAFFQQEKPMSIKFLVLGGGGGILGFGGGAVPIFFMGARIFLTTTSAKTGCTTERQRGKTKQKQGESWVERTPKHKGSEVDGPKIHTILQKTNTPQCQP